jgi:thiamine biosynthesis protein ThiI
MNMMIFLAVYIHMSLVDQLYNEQPYMLIYVKYGELYLKGKNRNQFIKCLFLSIKQVLKKFKKIEIKKAYDFMYIENVYEKDVSTILAILQNVPGISYSSLVYSCKPSFHELTNLINKNIINLKGSFKVITKRQDKQYELNSMELNAKIGGSILNANKDLFVDVHDPKYSIYVEIKRNNFLFYFEKKYGLGGFPLGINGRVLCLISGGIDSVIAAKLLIKKGFIVDFLTFITPPHTSPNALKKTLDLIDIITIKKTLYKPKIFIFKFTNLQHEIAHITIKAYQITIMRRYFFRIAKEIAIKFKYDAIATGESLGQVASQTTNSIIAIQNAIGEFLVLRPLFCFDKNEIIILAKKYCTYETSIIPHPDCCALFVPKNPITQPKIAICEKLEKEIPLVDTMCKNIFDNKYLTIK